jgi:hypothetical protein
MRAIPSVIFYLRVTTSSYMKLDFANRNDPALPLVGSQAKTPSP